MEEYMHRIGELQDNQAVAELGESLTKKGIAFHISQAIGENNQKNTILNYFK